MNKHARRLSIPVIPPKDYMIRNSSGENLPVGGAAVVVDTDLIFDIVVLYTREALAVDYGGRLIINPITFPEL
jgi:hypothetical protein